MSASGDTRVVCRVRPSRDAAAGAGAPSPVDARVDAREIHVLTAPSPSSSNSPSSSQHATTTTFAFDAVFDARARNDDVARACLAPALDDVCVRGVNATVMAYGQSGAGKTHTMEGPVGGDGGDDEGLISRASEPARLLVSSLSPRLPFPATRLNRAEVS